MFYWIYTKKNEVKPIISRNFTESSDAIKFATRNGLDWKHGELLSGGKLHGLLQNGALRVGSNLEPMPKPKVKAPKKRIAKNCDVIVSTKFDLQKVLYSLDSTCAKWKGTNAKPSSTMPDLFPMVIHVRSNRISWEPCINAVDINKKIK